MSTAAQTGPPGPLWAALERSRAGLDVGPARVNPSLTPDGETVLGPADEPQRARRRRQRAPRPPVETPEYAAMVRRIILAHGRRVADADVEDLAELIELQATLDEAIAYAIRESRARWGRSWADIARAAGVTRQAAYQRWGSR